MRDLRILFFAVWHRDRMYGLEGNSEKVEVN